MAELPEPIKSVLRDYCHVEWFELDELAEDVQTGRQKFDVEELKEQFQSLLSSHEDYVTEINQLTLNEFESEGELNEWLVGIYNAIFLDVRP
jgi:hypothetical protein